MFITREQFSRMEAMISLRGDRIDELSRIIGGLREEIAKLKLKESRFKPGDVVVLKSLKNVKMTVHTVELVEDRIIYTVDFWHPGKHDLCRGQYPECVFA